MNNTMEYQGYWGSVAYSDEDKVFHGKILFIRSLVTYEGESVKSLTRAFHEAVDDYLAWCKKEGRSPERPLKGSFNIRVSPELHRQAVAMAETKNTSLNKVVAEALQHYMQQA